MSQFKTCVGVEIQFKDGTKEWVDPVEEEDILLIMVDDGDYYVINNDFGTYSYLREDILALVIYKVCPHCGFDVRWDRHHPTCQMYDINN